MWFLYWMLHLNGNDKININRMKIKVKADDNDFSRLPKLNYFLYLFYNIHILLLNI